MSLLFINCYRKKLSKFSHNPDWQHASNNVAKCYMREQERQVYEQDVQLQMDAKMLGDKYNKRNPPKKVHLGSGVHVFCTVCIIVDSSVYNMLSSLNICPVYM